MDAEATTSRTGSPAGLNWYGGYFEPDKSRPRTEVCWSQRLAQLLPKHGYPTRAEVPYPAMQRCKCDDVVTLEDGSTLWLENKGAWREYWRERGNLKTYRSYLLHPLVPGLDASKSHTVPLDLKKLESLRRPHADRVALLLIGFDTNQHSMVGDIAELTRLAGLEAAPWSEAADNWADPCRPGCNVRCWLWHRTVAAS